MKKTIATCLLLIIILSCVFSFIGCENSREFEIVGYYKYCKSTSGSYDQYWCIKKDHTAILYFVIKDTKKIDHQTEYTWSFNEATQEYRFVDQSMFSAGNVITFVLIPPKTYPNDGLAHDVELDDKGYYKMIYERYENSDWLQ